MIATPEEFIFNRLKEDAGLALIVGDRIYPSLAPDGVIRPYITFHGVSGQSIHSLDGPSGIAQDRYQIDCWSMNLLEAGGIRELVRVAFQSFRGAIASVPTFEVQECTYQKGPSLIESDTRLHHLIAFIFLGYKEVQA